MVNAKAFNYTAWLDEVEQKAIQVNQRRLTNLLTNTPRAVQIAKMKEAHNYLRLFMRFVSLNRQVLFSIHAERTLPPVDPFD